MLQKKPAATASPRQFTDEEIREERLRIMQERILLLERDLFELERMTGKRGRIYH